MSPTLAHRSRRRTRRLAPLAGLVALAIAGSSAIAVSPAAALQKGGNGIGLGEAGCVYNGYTYNVGERIVVFTGASYRIYYCGEDGDWHPTENDPGVVRSTGQRIGVIVSNGQARR